MVIFGTGGHAKVVCEIARRSGQHRVAYFIDPYFSGEKFLDIPVLTDEGRLAGTKDTSGIIAIGDNGIRARIAERVRANNPEFQFVTLIDPSAVVGSDVQIAEGSVVMPGAVVNVGSKIGRHCILNTRCSVDHDCVLGDYSSLAPGVTLGGTVSVGSYTSLGVGVSVIHNIFIGRKSILGAGAVVVENVPDLTLSFGNPCRTVRPRTEDEPYITKKENRLSGGK